jgi:hypothetical protein
MSYIITRLTPPSRLVSTQLRRLTSCRVNYATSQSHCHYESKYAESLNRIAKE